MIRVRDLLVRYGATTALRLPALEIEQGERLGIVGANGSGKTTLLRVLAGLLSPTAGLVEGRPPRGRIVLVHQRPYLFRGTARDNVDYALRLRRSASNGGADKWLELVGARALADRPARVLSGGEQRRVTIARALAAQPDVLLLDEAFTELDDEGRTRVREAVEAYGRTVVVAAPSRDGLPVGRVVELERTDAAAKS